MSRRIPIALCGAAAAILLVVGYVGLGGSAQAATLFSDTFEDGNSAGWTTSGGAWSIASDGTGVFRQSSTSSDARARAGQTGWTDYTVTARVKPISFNGTDRFAAVLARAQSNTSYYYLTLRSSNRVELRKLVGGSATTLASAALTVTTGTWYTLTLQVAGTTLRGWVNGGTPLTATDSQYSAGQIGLATFNTSASFDDVLVDDGGAPPTTTPPTTTSPTTTTPPAGQADGFASVNALGQNGTTGGAGGPTVTITNATQLADYAGRAGPFILLISGTITFDDMITVVANKSIIGVGSTARISGGGLQLGSTTRPGNNVIIRNITFADASDDSVSVTNSAHHVWIDHNEFLPGFDGSVDVKRQSTYVTVSWNRFRGTDKSMLLGHSDSFIQDVGFLKVTYHHNYFDGSNQRHPRARFGDPVHVYNNYYRAVGLYGIASTENAGVLAENNYFENVAFPCHSASGYADSGPGRLVARGNAFAGSGVCEVNGSVPESSGWYGYRLDPAANVPSLVTAGAGVGRI